jgi:hypothetical protein
VSQLDDVDDPPGQRTRTAWNLAEIVAVGLLVILFLLLVTSLIGSVTTPYLFSSINFGAPGRHIDVGLALERAGVWASPQSAAIFVLGSMALAWWQIESWTRDDGDAFDEEAFVHLRRAAIVTRLDLVLSLLTIVGGVLVGVGIALAQSPGQNWSTFVVDIGVVLGSVVLGVVGVVAARRLLDGGLAAAATWHAPPTAA